MVWALSSSAIPCKCSLPKRWYSVHVLSNFEKKVAESIRDAVRVQGLEEEIEEVMVPTEEVVEIRRGQKVNVERRFMPGYVLVKMEMTDRAYHVINDTPRVTGFLGPRAVRRRCAIRRWPGSRTRSRKGSSIRAPRSPSRSASK